jgi:hypothetical protein
VDATLQITISGVDYAPGDLYGQTPIIVDFVREIPGDDRPDYWLGVSRSPIRWLLDNHERLVTHVILAARWEGTRIEPGIKDLPVGIAYVTDQSLLDDERLTLSKCSFVAIGIAHDGCLAPFLEHD